MEAAQLTYSLSNLGYTNISELRGGYNNPVFIAYKNNKPIVLKFAKYVEKEFEIQKHFSQFLLTPKVFDLFEQTDIPAFYTMEFIENTNLWKILKTQGEQDILKYFKEVGILIKTVIQDYKYESIVTPFILTNEPFNFLEENAFYKLKFYTNIFNSNLTGLKFSHGDFTTKNIVLAARNLMAIDWEAGKMSSRYKDLATLIWYCSYHHTEVWKTLTRELLSGYGEEIDNTVLFANILVHIAGVIQNLNITDIAAVTNWQKRLVIVLTLESEFLSL